MESFSVRPPSSSHEFHTRAPPGEQPASTGKLNKSQGQVGTGKGARTSDDGCPSRIQTKGSALHRRGPEASTCFPSAEKVTAVHRGSGGAWDSPSISAQNKL